MSPIDPQSVPSSERTDNLYICKICHKPAARRKPCATIHELDGMCLGCWRDLQEQREPVVITKCENPDGIWATTKDIKIAGLERDLESAQATVAQQAERIAELEGKLAKEEQANLDHAEDWAFCGLDLKSVTAQALTLRSELRRLGQAMGTDGNAWHTIVDAALFSLRQLAERAEAAELLAKGLKDKADLAGELANALQRFTHSFEGGEVGTVENGAVIDLLARFAALTEGSARAG